MTISPHFIDDNAVADALDWDRVIAALHAGHKLEKAEVRDVVLGETGRSFLNRAAWIDGLGGGVKSVTIFPDNPHREEPLPSVQGVFLLFDDGTGAINAVIDGPLITKWKTAADSVLGARLLARKNARKVLVIGAGALAAALVEAYAAALPQVEEIAVWARSAEKARALTAASSISKVAVVEGDLALAVGAADIIVTATSSRTPVLKGDWVRPGAHIDLVGAFRADMREADDALMKKSRIFVDSRDTTIEHIGDLTMPIAAGVITREDVLGDLYDLIPGGSGRRSDDDITVFKNGGGAHLDLMTAAVIHEAARAKRNN